MANVNSPFGFQQYQGGAGGAPTFSETPRLIASTNTFAIFSGDPVNPVISTASGYITAGVPGTVRIDGIFNGCQYLSTSQKRTVWSNYWPGSDATGAVTAQIIDDPNARFICQGNSTTFNITGTVASPTLTPVGQYAQYAIGTGTAANGRSGAFLNSLGTTVTFPFIVLALPGLGVGGPPGSDGTDPLSASNDVIVGFNNEMLRANGAGPTGIS